MKSSNVTSIQITKNQVIHANPICIYTYKKQPMTSHSTSQTAY